MTTAQRVDVGSIPQWTLGWRLARSLAHAGMTMQEMADELGVARTTVSRWINDHGAPPRRAFVNQWSLITGVPVQWLLTGEVPDGHPNGGAAGAAGDTRVNCCWFEFAGPEAGAWTERAA